MQIIDVFSGIGGFSYAGKLMGWRTIQFCEIDKFCQKVLSYHWPGVPIHDNIKTLTAEQIKNNPLYNENETTIFVGGVPCQPWSVAGKRLGKADDRDLWEETIKLVGQVKPDWCLLENVRGLVNWSGGLVFEQVQADLEAQGYEVLPFILPACAVDAPHRRDRVWFIAYSESFDDKRIKREVSETKCRQKFNNLSSFRKPSNRLCFARPTSNTTSQGREEREQCNGREISEEVERGQNDRPERPGQKRVVTDTYNNRLQGGVSTNINKQPSGEGTSTKEHLSAYRKRVQFQNFPTQPPVRSRDDGFSRQLVRYITQELYYEISKTSKENRIENLQEVWERISSPEVWEKIRVFYSLESKDILFQTMQLYSTATKSQVELSPFSEEISKSPLRTLQKYGEFRSSPQGQKLEKQRSEQFGDSLSFLPHEVALAAKAYTDSIRKFETWHRQESIKAYGNAVVPPLVLEIFKAIEAYEIINKHT